MFFQTGTDGSRGQRCRKSPHCRHRLRVAIFAFAVGITALAIRSEAQIIFPNEPTEAPPSEWESQQRFPREPLLEADFSRAADALRGQDVVQGLEMLQELLDEGRESYQPNATGGTGSLLGRVEESIRPHMAEYERLMGTRAQQQLELARSQQDLRNVQDVARRYGLTKAGAAALEILAQWNSDRGEPARAARLWEQIAGHPQAGDSVAALRQAQATLLAAGERSLADALLSRHAGKLELVESPEITPDPAAQALLYDWRQPGGNPEQSGRANAAPVLSEFAWSSPLIHEYDFWSLLPDQPLMDRLLQDSERLQQAMDSRVRANPSRVVFPAGRPLIVDNLVIFSGPGSVKACQLETGELQWNTSLVDPTFDYLAKRSFTPSEAQDAIREDMRLLFAGVRGYRDLTAGSISSDGKQVYLISDCQLVGTTSPQRIMQNTPRHPLLPQRSNQLHAFDIAAEGKRRWSIGTPAPEAWPFQDAEQPPRQIYFFGAPLAVDDRLYAIGESSGQVELYEIEPETGNIVWAIALLNPGQGRDLLLDQTRRLSGLSPVWGGGLLICPTSDGVLTAIDPLQRRIVWTSTYSQSESPRRNPVWMFRMLPSQSETLEQSLEELLTDQRWLDGRLVVTGDSVVFTPPDHDEVVCLSLSDGKPRWSQPFPRRQLVALATVFRDQLILVGRSEISAVKLSDGTAAWSQPTPIPAPSGRGVRMGDRYLQPLHTGEIAVVDLPSGRLLTRLPTPETAPGNLVASGGMLVMQTAQRLAAFPARSNVESQIAAPATSEFEQLALAGEWALQQGEIETGLAQLRRALALEPTAPRVRKVLLWALLDGLRTDFAAYRDAVPEIQQVITDGEQRLQFLRTYAQGLQGSGELSNALDHYLEILRQLPPQQPLRDLDSRWAASDSAWVSGRLAEIFANASPADRAELTSRLQRWLVETNADKALASACQWPVDWMTAEFLLEKLQAAPVDGVDPRVREALLQRIGEASTAPLSREIAQTQLRLAVEQQQPDWASELVQSLRAGDPSLEIAVLTGEIAGLAEQLEKAPPWAAKPVLEDQSQLASRPAMFQVPILGPRTGPLRGWSFFLDQHGANLSVIDAQGRLATRIATGLPAPRNTLGSTVGRYVNIRNHMALVVLLDRFLLIDCYSSPREPVLRGQWPLTDDSAATSGTRVFVSNNQRPRAGIRSMLFELPFGGPAGNVSPLTDNILCYTRGSNLIAMNPRSGEELWRRRDVSPGVELFGDDEWVTAINPYQPDEFRVFHATDGREAPRVQVPRQMLRFLDWRGGDWGRRAPLAELTEDGWRLSLFDTATGAVDWAVTGELGTRWTCVNGRDFALLSPEHELKLIDARSGAARWSTQLEVEARVEQFTLEESPTQFLFFSSSFGPLLTQQRGEIYGVAPHELARVQVDGVVASLDRQSGAVQWTRSLADQQWASQTPGAWPVLLFGRSKNRRFEWIVLNRSTGEDVGVNATRDDGSWITWTGEAEPPRMEVYFATAAVTVRSGEAPPRPPRFNPLRNPPPQAPEGPLKEN